MFKLLCHNLSHDYKIAFVLHSNTNYHKSIKQASYKLLQLDKLKAKNLPEFKTFCLIYNVVKNF